MGYGYGWPQAPALLLQARRRPLVRATSAHHLSVYPEEEEAEVLVALTNGGEAGGRPWLQRAAMVDNGNRLRASGGQLAWLAGLLFLRTPGV
ncbi:hypothetical protein TYRP_011520 [Tyrophagus putrescentiae]|nr:hypothetical protein TYRP_011520 [Tyrophagus putrescentiae]